MKRLLLLAALTLAVADARALPSYVPPAFDGMASFGLGTDSACTGTAPFMFQQVQPPGSFRIVLTKPACFVGKFKLQELVIVNGTAAGSLWAIVLRTNDAGNDDGPFVHMTPGNPKHQDAMRWGQGERRVYTIIGRPEPTTPNHYELRFTPVP